MPEQPDGRIAVVDPGPEPDREPHEVLGVAPDAREEAIRGAFERLVKAAHADQGDDRDLDVQELQEARDEPLDDG